MHNFPPPQPDASLKERFGWFVKALGLLVFDFGRREPAKEPVTEVVRTRLRRALDRFHSLLARFEAGTLTPPRPRPARARPEPADAEPPAPRPPGARLPRHLGWLWEISGDIEIHRMGQGLHYLVTNDAGMRALIQAAPDRMGRLIRPIMWMAGVAQIPPILVPPEPGYVMKRWMAGDAGKRAPKPPAPPPPPPKPFFASLMPTPEQQEAEARRYANRPGGLIWLWEDGHWRLGWS
jgi:hypothetical protein